MAEKMEIKTLLESVVLVQKGKVVTVPVGDNYAVYPKEGSPLKLMPGKEVEKQLKLAYPKCVFTWFAKTFKEPAIEKAKDDGKTDDKGKK